MSLDFRTDYMINRGNVFKFGYSSEDNQELG